jgi:hypothetical protein
MVKFLKIPRGTLLFRTSFSKNPLTPTKCEDTDKIGVYFSTIPSIALGMALEYKSNMFFNIFKLKKDLNAIEGKYSFRHINPERYFDAYNNFIPNVSIIPNENVNHFEAHVYPIIEIDGIKSNDFIKDELPTDGELFISTRDLGKVQLLETFAVDWNKLANEWREKQPFFRDEMFKGSLIWKTITRSRRFSKSKSLKKKSRPIPRSRRLSKSKSLKKKSRPIPRSRRFSKYKSRKSSQIYL